MLKQTPSFWSFIFCPIKSLFFWKFLMTLLHVIYGLALPLVQNPGYAYQRWSRGHKARGQGQRHKKNPRPRPRTAFPRTDPLEAKAKDQGHRRKCSPTKSRQKFFSGDLQFIGVPRTLIGGGLNHKSHEMTSSKFFHRESFCGTKISHDGRSEIVTCLHVTRILQRERA